MITPGSPATRLTWAERFRAAMLGGAVGDALGAAARQLSTEEVHRWYGPTGLVDYAPVYGRRGQASDLTQLTAFTLEALLRTQANVGTEGVALPYVFRNYLRWTHTQGVPWPFAMRWHLSEEPTPAGWLLGRSELYSTRNPSGRTLAALGRMAQRPPLGPSGDIHPVHADEGPVDCLVWTAPGAVAASRPDTAYGMASSVANLFTSAPNTRAAAGTHGYVLARLLRGAPLWEAVGDADEQLAARGDPQRFPIAVRQLLHGAMFLARREKHLAPGELDVEFDLSSGLGEFGIALAAVGRTPTLADAVRAAVNHSADSAVAGALAGQLAGALYGPAAIPGPWLEQLELRDIVETLCQDAVDAFGVPQWTRRYTSHPDATDPSTGPLALPSRSITVDGNVAHDPAGQPPGTAPSAAGPEVPVAPTEQTMVLPAIQPSDAEHARDAAETAHPEGVSSAFDSWEMQRSSGAEFDESTGAGEEFVPHAVAKPASPGAEPSAEAERPSAFAGDERFRAPIPMDQQSVVEDPTLLRQVPAVPAEDSIRSADGMDAADSSEPEDSTREADPSTSTSDQPSSVVSPVDPVPASPEPQHSAPAGSTGEHSTRHAAVAADGADPVDDVERPVAGRAVPGGEHAKGAALGPDEPSLTERVLGCFLGGALGDSSGGELATGLSYAGQQPGEAGASESRNTSGTITDATRMTLFTAEGLIRGSLAMRTLDATDPLPEVQLAYQRWLHTQGVHWDAAVGPFRDDYLNPDGWLVETAGLFSRRIPSETVLRELAHFGLNRQPPGTTDSRINEASDCGAITRVAPVALYTADPSEVFELAARSAALTHGAASGFLPAGAFAVIVQQALLGRGLDDGVWLALQVMETWPGHEETSALLKVAVELAKRGVPSETELVRVLGEGRGAEQALAIAVCAALVAADDVALALRVAVRQPGDRHSSGAVCGNIVGALHGLAALPVDGLAGLELREVVQRMALDCAAEFGHGNFAWGADQDMSAPNDTDWHTRYPVRPLPAVDAQASPGGAPSAWGLADWVLSDRTLDDEKFDNHTSNPEEQEGSSDTQRREPTESLSTGGDSTDGDEQRLLDELPEDVDAPGEPKHPRHDEEPRGRNEWVETYEYPATSARVGGSDGRGNYEAPRGQESSGDHEYWEPAESWERGPGSSGRAESLSGQPDPSIPEEAVAFARTPVSDEGAGGFADGAHLAGGVARDMDAPRNGDVSRETSNAPPGVGDSETAAKPAGSAPADPESDRADAGSEFGVEVPRADVPSPGTASPDAASTGTASSDLPSSDLPEPDLPSMDLPSSDLPSSDLPRPALLDSENSGFHASPGFGTLDSADRPAESADLGASDVDFVRHTSMAAPHLGGRGSGAFAGAATEPTERAEPTEPTERAEHGEDTAYPHSASLAGVPATGGVEPDEPVTGVSGTDETWDEITTSGPVATSTGPSVLLGDPPAPEDTDQNATQPSTPDQTVGDRDVLSWVPPERPAPAQPAISEQSTEHVAEPGISYSTSDDADASGAAATSDEAVPHSAVPRAFAGTSADISESSDEHAAAAGERVARDMSEEATDQQATDQHATDQHATDQHVAEPGASTQRIEVPSESDGSGFPTPKPAPRRINGVVDTTPPAGTSG